MKTLEKILQLIKTFSLLNKNDVEFGSILVLTHENIENIIEEYEYKKRMDINGKMNLIRHVKDNDYADEIPGERMAKYTIKFFEHWITDKNNPIDSRLCRDFISRLATKKGRFCSSSHCIGRWFGIHPDGTIQPCGRDWKKSVSFGNIHNVNSIKEILEHPNFIRFKEETKELRKKCKEECDFFYACQGGCYANNYAVTEDFTKRNENYCVFTRKVLSYVFNRIKNIDPLVENNDYNPYFIKHLNRLGFRNMKQIKQFEKNKKNIINDEEVNLNF
jgi:radical SAM protein with 4Fe4S-binding SPASM domain